MLGESKAIGAYYQISQLRLVCRLWSILLDSTWRPYLYTKNALVIGNHRDIRVLSVKDIRECDYNVYDKYPLDESLLGATRNLNTVILSSTIWQKGDGFLDFFFSHSEYFQNVRSFHYFNYTDLPSDFWTRLETTFPLLTALSVTSFGQNEAVVASGNIRFQGLEILDMRTDHTFHLPHFHFPSLKHFSSYNDPTSPICAQILQNHANGIESLLIPYHYLEWMEFFGKEFWMQFPKLRLIGAISSRLGELPLPPTGHPFNHICLWDPKLQAVQNLIGRFPTLRYLSTLSRNPTEENAQQITLIDRFITNNEGKQLNIGLYGDYLPLEFDQLSKRGSWKKERCLPHFGISYFQCGWELK